MDSSVDALNSPVSETKEASTFQAGRSMALDVFRGLTILLMLFVNNVMVADVSPVIAHGEWSGTIGLADLVFPWFLLAVGVSMSFSWEKFRLRGSLASYVRRAGKRAVILVLIGMFLDSAVQRQVTIGLGVLQIIGIAFFIAAAFMGTSIIVRGSLAALMLVGYAVFLHSTPVPNFGAGNFTAEGNAAQMVNDLLTPFGLRGLPSALPTGAAVLFGSVLGTIWAKYDKSRIASSLGIGACLVAAGAIWSYVTPALKPIWTPSYICLTVGAGAILLGLMSVLEFAKLGDILSPVRAAGSSPIFAYVAPILFKVMILQNWSLPGESETLEQSGVAWMQGQFGSDIGPWVYTATLIAVWWAVFIWMDWKKIVVKV